MITVFAATENTDRTEGRGPMRTIALFSEKSDAQQAVQGRGVMGVGDGVVTTARIYDSYEEYLNDKDEQLRQQALKKLTPDERRVLRL